MKKFTNWLFAYFTKRNTFKIVVIELMIIALLLCVAVAMNVDINMTLQGDGVMTVEKGDTFVDPGATAVADGRDLEVEVAGEVNTAVPGTYTLRYRAKYLLSSKEITRTVHVVNTRPPALSLVGETQILLTMGDNFEEPGFTATDNNGRDITARVRRTGTVDPMTPGTYTITYTVADDAGRTTTVQRIITVELAKQPEVIQPEGKVIYLTFDDGPGPYTQQLLAVLAKYNAKATFFVVGKNANLAHNLKAIADGGHGIGIHSVTHDYKTIYANQDAFLADVYAMQDLIQQHTGVKTTLMRFPGGSSNRLKDNKCQMSQLVQKVTDLGFQYFDWNVDSNDAGGAKTADEVYRNVISGIGNMKTACVLMHDIKGYSVDAVERILQWGIANGYTFQVLTPNSPGFRHLETK